mgnify:FL=1
MEYYEQSVRKIPIRDHVDVLVAGGGPAGFGAALSAARMGKKTLLIEQSGSIGGMATNGLMSHWTGYQEGGIFAELRQKARDCESPEVINPEKVKFLMLDMLREAKVSVQLQSMITDVVMDGSRLSGVVCESKSGPEVYISKIIIDSTGDGDIAFKSGVPFEKGREDGRMQPVTIMFKVAGVDMDRAMFFWGFEDTVRLPEGDLQTLAQEKLPSPAGHVLLYPSSIPGLTTVNMTNMIDVDGTDVHQLSQAEYQLRGQIEPIVQFLRDYVPGYEMCYVIDSASSVGVRETRRFIGDYQLTSQDIKRATKFDDWVVTRSHFFFDMHNVKGSGLDAAGVYKGFHQTRTYTIPYRCFIPKKIDGLLLNGRNISGDHLAHSSYRVMPICVNMGHAMGVAAAKCIDLDIQPRKLNVTKIQKVLRTQNVEPEEE